jgi:uncharacterized surface protein with fasciclin (FAS1) repeats/virulence-associated protein VapD
MIKIKQFFFPALIIIFLSCDDEIINKYERPEWLAGKIYTQILNEPELSVFAKCLELTGYDTIINTSGSYTVFAPSNDAFDAYLISNPSYNSLNDIPLAELNEMVKYHIVQNAWTKIQLRSLDVHGWIDTLDIANNQARGFKRQTLLRSTNRKFGIVTNIIDNKGVFIVDTLKSDWYRRVITDSRKYVPFFYKEYFDIYNLELSDYEFYFNRSFERVNDIYFANARITSDEIFAENGFIYIIDQVVEPLRNVYEIMESKHTGEDYSQFLDLINRFPKFDYNEQQTFKQPGADQGLIVDSLFDLSYPDLTFYIYDEKTNPPPGVIGLPNEVTVRYHYGLMAPTNSAFNDFINNYINIPNGWGSLDQIPNDIKKIIVNTHMSRNPIYPNNFIRGFYNGEDDLVKLDESYIAEKIFGSNSTFIGLKEAIVPRAFKSITGAVYLNKGFSTVMNAIEKTKLLPALKREDRDYMFFIEHDQNLVIDSSLFYNRLTERFLAFYLATEEGTAIEVKLTYDDIRTLLFNHVAIDQAKGLARKEFIPNMSRNFLIFNNETGEVSGTAPTTFGFQGSEIVPEYPRLIPIDFDNGTAYEINNWFSFVVADIFTKIQTDYPYFHNLLRKASLTVDKEYRYTFISNSEYYTVFIPTQQALEEINTDSYSKEELQQFLMLHFIQGHFIFTDGNKAPGYYETLRLDEKSTAFSRVYTKLYIEPGVDVIRFKSKNGSDYHEFEESESTNILTGISLNKGQEAIPNIRNNAVIHEIGKPLLVNQLQTK